jgi:hypothetical protein
MSDLLKKFVAATEELSCKNKSMRERVYGAYFDHLRGIDPNDLPEHMQLIYESVEMRLISVKPPADIGVDEASYLAQDIIYMADVMRQQHKA